MNPTLEKLLGFPKSLWVNLKIFPFKTAIRMPLLVGYKVTLGVLEKGCIELPETVSRFMIRFGVGGVPSVDENRKGHLQVAVGGRLHFEGPAGFGPGTSLICDGGNIYFGDRFSCNNNCYISCHSTITIGRESMWGWNVSLFDSDNHPIYKKGVKTAGCAPITLGKHVWMCAHSNLLKGASIPDDSIVASHSVVTKSFTEPHSLIGGYPAKVLSSDVTWEA